MRFRGRTLRRYGENPFARADQTGSRTLAFRAIALGRFLLFAVLALALLKLLGFLAGLLHLNIRTLYWSAIFGNAQVVIASLGATAIMARIDGRSFAAYGLEDERWLRRFVLGAACGFVALTVLLVAMRLSGAYSFGSAQTHGIALAEFALVYAALFFIVAFSEETLFRGYALMALAESISFWPAAIILGLIFGLSHSHHAAESHAGLIFAGLYGVVLSYSFRRGCSLWFAFGLHAMWDYSESFIYGVPDSGVVVPGCWLAPKIHGPLWLTGGSVGPEGSYLMIFVLAGLMLAAHKLLRPAGGAQLVPQNQKMGH